ncbi:MAG: hypothetical protein ACI959_000999 [Limisphaerales bacterium]|jgi:uncharacterized protein
MEDAKAVSKAVGLDESEAQLVQVAAAYHDCGFLQTYKKHEEVSCEMSAEILPDFGFDKENINQIQDLIMATKIPQVPTSLSAQVLCDADLYYLGGEDYDSVSNLLYVELKANGFDLTESDWLEMQINFLKHHHYWTPFAITNLKKGKEMVLAKLKGL